VTSNPEIAVNSNLQAYDHQPDLIQFFIPVEFSRFLALPLTEH
jgi:hypothetical protein